LKEDDKK
jgi:hypothetical protein